MKVVLRSTTMGRGAPCVMITVALATPGWCAGSWGLMGPRRPYPINGFFTLWPPTTSPSTWMMCAAMATNCPSPSATITVMEFTTATMGKMLGCGVMVSVGEWDVGRVVMLGGVVMVVMVGGW